MGKTTTCNHMKSKKLLWRMNIIIIICILCNFNSTESSNKTHPSDPSCILPQISLNKNFTVNCYFNGSRYSSETGRKLPNGTQISFSCSTDHQGSGPSEAAAFVGLSTCSEGKWNPAISKCYRYYTSCN